MLYNSVIAQKLNNMFHRLKIENLELKVHLGWPEEERQNLQKVCINITLTFPGKPMAAETDELTDTVCYASIADDLKAQLQGQTFKLLEHLGEHCYEIVNKHVLGAKKIELSITKFLSKEEGNRTFELVVE